MPHARSRGSEQEDNNWSLNRRIGATVRALRDNAGLTLREVASRTGGQVAYSNLSALERGARNWLPHQIEAVAEALGVEPRDLVPPLRARENPPGPTLRDEEVALIEAIRRRDWKEAVRQLGRLAAE